MLALHLFPTGVKGGEHGVDVILSGTLEGLHTISAHHVKGRDTATLVHGASHALLEAEELTGGDGEGGGENHAIGESDSYVVHLLSSFCVHCTHVCTTVCSTWCDEHITLLKYSLLLSSSNEYMSRGDVPLVVVILLCCEKK